VVITLSAVVVRSADYLRRAGIDRARLEAELVIAHGLGLSRLDLYLQFDRPLDSPELSRLRPLVRLRASGCPLGYVLGTQEFCGRDFEVRVGVLIPRPESELLVEIGLDRLGDRAKLCADLGCGSGCLGVSLAAGDSEVEVDAVDISSVARDLTAANAEHHHVRDRLRTFEGEWSAPLWDRGPYQLIVTNPPYVTTAEWGELPTSVRDFEPRGALDGGSDGLASYRQLLPSLGRVTQPGSTVLIEGDPRRLPMLRALAIGTWPAAKTTIHRDLFGRERVLEVEVK